MCAYMYTHIYILYDIITAMTVLETTTDLTEFICSFNKCCTEQPQSC